MLLAMTYFLTSLLVNLSLSLLRLARGSGLRAVLLPELGRSVLVEFELAVTDCASLIGL